MEKIVLASIITYPLQVVYKRVLYKKIMLQENIYKDQIFNSCDFKITNGDIIDISTHIVSNLINYHMENSPIQFTSNSYMNCLISSAISNLPKLYSTNYKFSEHIVDILLNSLFVFISKRELKPYAIIYYSYLFASIRMIINYLIAALDSYDTNIITNTQFDFINMAKMIIFYAISGRYPLI